MTRIVLSYATKLRAVESRMAAFGEHVWLRMKDGDQVTNLLVERHKQQFSSQAITSGETQDTRGDHISARGPTHWCGGLSHFQDLHASPSALRGGPEGRPYTYTSQSRSTLSEAPCVK